MSILPKDTPILWNVDAQSEQDAFALALDLLCADSRVLNGVVLRKQVLDRQALSPPILGNGVALPHARSEAVSDIVFAVVKFREAVDIAGEKVSLMLVYAVPPSGVHEHLAMMAKLVRVFRDDATLAKILAAPDSGEFETAFLG